MKEFLKILRRFVPPYKKYLFLNIFFNILAAFLTLFSFALIIPILEMLFMGDKGVVYHYMDWTSGSFKDVAINNFYYSAYYCKIHLGPSVTLMLLAVALVVMTAFKTGATYLSLYFLIPIRSGIVRDIRNFVYDKILNLPIGFFSSERKGDVMARMSGDVAEVENSIMASLDMMFKNPIMIVVCLGMMIVISWQLTIFVFVLLPVAGLVMGRIGKRLKRTSLVGQQQWGTLMSTIEETLGGLRIVKAFNAEHKMSARFHGENQLFYNTSNRINRRQSLAHPMSEFLGTVMIVIVLWFGGVLVLNNMTLSGPTFIYYLVILYSIINPLKEFSKAGYNIPKGLASMERVDKILMAESNIKEPEHPVHITDFKSKIEFRNVSFKYDQKWVLRNINLTIEKGKTVALVGQSGGGKSTLVDLIPRYYDVQEGEVLIDGVNVKDMGLHDLRSLIGNVNQEAILFNDSFRNNISFGVDNATQEQIENAARIANAHDFIMESEHGYDTNIGDRGGRLSGGQRQRVSIARAILKNPPILILDEATSALDTESERLVQDALEHLMKTRTTVAIAHRLSTIKNADEICVIHEGEIVERGTHEELLAIDGYYKKLNDMQTL